MDGVLFDDADKKKPFCGNAMSDKSDNTNNIVKKGECGKCQVKKEGGGKASLCTKDSAADTCPTDTSCGPTKVCCLTGECAKVKTDCEDP